MSKPLNSAVVIARLLGTEGFTDYVANSVHKYWRKSSGLSPRQQNKLKHLEENMTGICKKLSEGDKMVLGRFISYHKKMSFDTGLKIGLTCILHEDAKDVEKVEISKDTLKIDECPF